jgi:hypothetical protein
VRAGLRLWPAVLLATVAAGWPHGAGATARAPEAARMVLGADDFPRGATVVSESGARNGALPPIAITSAYTRSLRDVRWGSARLVTVQSSAEAARTPHEAAAAIAPLLDVASSLADRKAVVDEVRRRLGSRSPVTTVSISRTRGLYLGGGDRGVEVVLRLRRGDSSFLIGEEWVNVRNGIGLTFWSAPEPGLTGSEGLSLARAIQRRMRLALESPPQSTVAPAIVGYPTIGATLTATRGRWSPAGEAFSFRWLRCAWAAVQCVPIRFATAQAYTPTPADRGSTLVVAVTAANAVGSTTVRSQPTTGVS